MRVSTHPAGTCCWVELGTTDQDAARRFYGELFGWTMNESSIATGEPYTILKRNGLDLGGLRGLTAADRSRGTPAHWLVYVAVDDVDAITPRVPALGGSVAAGPFDVGSSGRMSMVADAEGAMFALWQAKEHTGSMIQREDGAVSWTELATHDRVRARSFYGSLFGWSFEERTAPEIPYLFARLGDRMVAGIFPLEGAPMQNVPAQWMVYFQVADCDARAEWVSSHGGRIVVAPTDVPGWGRFAVLQDLQGAAFSVVETRD